MIHQRRLTIVTDDYVILADYLKGKENHVFDNLLQLRGAQPGDNLKWVSHSPQWDNDPLSSGQFITNVNRYEYKQGGEIKSVHHFAPRGKDGMNLAINNWETGGQNRLYNEPGNLNIDAYMVWPRKAEISIGDYAEDWGINKKMDYQVIADGELMNRGSIGAWILGKHYLNVPLENKKELTFIVKTDRRQGRKRL